MPSSGCSYATTVFRAWRLRCPQCGHGKLFKNWFRMYPECEHCHLHYEREPGYFLGSIYVNYGLTAVIASAFAIPMIVGQYIQPELAIGIAVAFVAVFPLWFFRYARSLWLGFDHYWDPRPADSVTATDRVTAAPSSKG